MNDTLRLSSVALLGYPAVGHCWDIPWLGTAAILCSWALLGCSADILRLGRDTLR